MSIFQIIATFFALFMLYVTRIHKKQLNFSLSETFFWYSLWTLFIVIALFPDLLIGFTQLLHFSRVFDLLTVGALMVITVIVILNNFNQRRDSQRIEKFVREHAIKNASKKSR
ncbi:MAG: DUF2304 domain-containing protein [Candidatus Pacebacteria bacterium]|jgi:hypothetical protein|nr:DUF2304 domain-containing protein [Candidatus Paceibacterota bacterium]MBT6756047.1 DUF2304 domain-containing protein [Candidatus Paceibacterota bacterium]